MRGSGHTCVRLLTSGKESKIWPVSLKSDQTLSGQGNTSRPLSYYSTLHLQHRPPAAKVGPGDYGPSRTRDGEHDRRPGIERHPMLGPIWEGVVKNKYEELRLRRLRSCSPRPCPRPRRRFCLIFTPDHVRTLNHLRACRPRSLPHRRLCRLFLPGQRMRTPSTLEDDPEEATQFPCLRRRLDRWI